MNKITQKELIKLGTPVNYLYLYKSINKKQKIKTEQDLLYLKINIFKINTPLANE